MATGKKPAAGGTTAKKDSGKKPAAGAKKGGKSKEM
jgi:hypothetical protein